MDLLSQLNTQKNWKKVKIKINTPTLIENWKNWNMKMMFILIVIGVLGKCPKDWLKEWRTWEWEDEWRSSKQHCWDRQEYWEDSWKLDDTCCYSKSSERPANADVKNSQGVNNDNNNNNNNNNDIDRLYGSRKEERRGLASIEGRVNTSI